MSSPGSSSGKPTPRANPPVKPAEGRKPAAVDAAGKSTQTTAAKTDSRAVLTELKKVGRYAIIKKIGQGGMGAVFLANDTQLKRQVALKVLPKDKAENPTLVKRFKAEAQAAAQLKHDNIVAIHDAGEADGLLYIALEFIDGTDAHTIVAKRGPMPAKRATDVIRQVALALQHAYEQKIVHRDIKPSNVLVCKDGSVKLTDMGLARSVDESVETNITRAGTTVGTVDYMSPEQARNSKLADTRSDLYSLGAMWFHLLAGHPPFHEGSMVNKLNAHSSKARPDIRDVNEAVSESTSVMIKRMMAIKPEDRYQTPAELLADLDNENLMRGPMSLRDLAALAAEEDDEDEDAPKASYKKPEAKEAKQLMAPTAEIPVMPTATSALPKPSGINVGSLKLLGIAAGIVAVIGGLGWLTSNFGSAVATSNNPGVNPFDRGPEVANSGTATTVNDAATNSSESTEKKSTLTPKPGSVEVKKGPKSLAGGVKPANAKEVGAKAVAPPAGSLYLPPLGMLGRDGETKFFPDWITENGSPVPSELTNILVGGGPSGLEQVPTLGQALRKLPEAGGIVELVTDGPYFLGPTELLDRATVVIRAANDARPVVVLVAEPDQPYDALLKLTNGALSLEGLDIRIFARQFANADPLALFSVRGGDVAAVRCSFTLVGNRPGKTFVFATEGKIARSNPKESSAARLLTRDCLVRGSALGVFQLDSVANVLVASRCLFVTGTAPVLTLTNHEPPLDESSAPKSSSSKSATGEQSSGATSGASKSPAVKSTLKPTVKPKSNALVSDAVRSLRFLSCTLLSSATAFELAAGVDPSNPPTSEVSIINSVLAGNVGPQSAPVLLALPGWTQRLLPADNESTYPNLRWVIESSFVCGWQKLIREEPGATTVVRDGATWKSIWKNQVSLDESQFQATGWPKLPLSDLANVKPVDLVLPSDLGVKGTDGQPAGSPFVELKEANLLTLSRAEALADRAQHPVVGWEPFAINKTIEVNPHSQDLGRVLATENWPNGTLVIVRGSGPAETTPILVKGKALRIEFKNSGEAPLVLSSRKSSSSSKDDEAMFILEGGSLELVDGQFRFGNTASDPVPQYFLSAYDADFAINGCQITGPTLDGSRQYQGLIRWKRSQPESKDQAQPAERNSGLIVNSTLITTGRLLDADLRNRTLLLRNSLFASIGDLFDLNVQGFDPRLGATLDARWCTFGAGGKYLFQVRGTKETEQATRPLSAFFENSVFLSLTDLSGTSTPPVLLSVRDHVLTKKQISWWDQSNGYVSAFNQLVRAADTPPTGAQSFASNWNSLWGAAQVIRPLTTNDGVRLVAKLPHRSQIAPRDFLLATDCTAASWGANQTSLGFDSDRTASAVKRTSSGAGTTKPDPVKTPPKTTPSTKTTKPGKLNF